VTRTARALVVGPGEGPTVQGPAGGPLTFKVRGEQSGGALLVIENVIAPGDGPPEHTHAHEAEWWHVVEGDLRFKLDGELSVAPAGSFVYVPPGVPHAFQNTGEGPARILVSFSPAGMERFFDEFAALPDGPIDREAFARLGQAVGMEVVGPPLAVSHPL
jgi:quercetin dioxygenase-like cupin family protein